PEAFFFLYIAVPCFLSYTFGFFMYSNFWCDVHSAERLQAEYLIDWYFNREHTMRYNSTVGHWTGLSRAGFITASHFNEDDHDGFLPEPLQLVNLLIPVEPAVDLAEAAGSGPDTRLLCAAYDFYPKRIRVTWHRDGQEVTSGVTLSEAMPNGDWTYQVRSYLDFGPGRQHGVSCTVEHISLREPKVYHWEPSVNRSERGFLVGGVCALLLGAVVLSSGLIKYRRWFCPRA
uniref:Ig-like domain-containing protein n=1 Tax=Cyclopterus lumpus TaxID=8103 RepID=A0A8C2WG42_CYCLU